MHLAQSKLALVIISQLVAFASANATSLTAPQTFSATASLNLAEYSAAPDGIDPEGVKQFFVYTSDFYPTPFDNSLGTLSGAQVTLSGTNSTSYTSWCVLGNGCSHHFSPSYRVDLDGVPQLYGYAPTAGYQDFHQPFANLISVAGTGNGNVYPGASLQWTFALDANQQRPFNISTSSSSPQVTLELGFTVGSFGWTAHPPDPRGYPFVLSDISSDSTLSVNFQYIYTPAPPSPENYKQFTAPWGETLTLNSATEKMRATGCFVTAAAIMLNVEGYNGLNPGTLNEFLRGYMPSESGSLDWDKANNALQDGPEIDGVSGAAVRFRQESLTTGSTRDQIVAQLSDLITREGPVIIRVPTKYGDFNYGEGSFAGTHAIVAYAVSGDQILIRDPGYTGSGSTLDDYINFVNFFVMNQDHPERQLSNDLSWLLKNSSTRALTYVEALSPLSKTIVQGSVHSPVEVVITDPLGRRLGFDPINGIYYEEIPNSSYFRELSPIDPEAGLVALIDPILYFTIGEYIQGDYLFQVFGTGTGPWSITFGISDPNHGYDPLQYQYAGDATDGSYTEFRIALAEPSSVAEPSTVMMTATGLLAFVVCSFITRRRK